MSKNVVDTEGRQMTSQYGAYAFRAGLLRQYAHMRMHTPTLSDTHMHARARAQACTHRPTCNTHCFSTATMVLWARLSVTLYDYCLSWFMITASHQVCALTSLSCKNYNLPPFPNMIVCSHTGVKSCVDISWWNISWHMDWLRRANNPASTLPC
jgi:hypothetical protein